LIKFVDTLNYNITVKWCEDSQQKRLQLTDFTQRNTGDFDCRFKPWSTQCIILAMTLRTQPTGINWNQMRVDLSTLPGQVRKKHSANTIIQSWPKKRYPFYFCVNFRKRTPILTILSLLEQEIYGT